MARINEYLWHLPHTPESDDPPDVALLQEAFNQPVVEALLEPLGERGYQLKSSDVIVALDSQVDVDPEDGTELANTYLANVRFIKYLLPDVIARVHFEHLEWAQVVTGSERHRYAVALDRFKLRDPVSQIPVPAWPGRLHTRLAHVPGQLIPQHPDEAVQVYATPAELAEQLVAFLAQFARVGQPWLENPDTF